MAAAALYHNDAMLSRGRRWGEVSAAELVKRLASPKQILYTSRAGVFPSLIGGCYMRFAHVKTCQNLATVVHISPSFHPPTPIN